MEVENNWKLLKEKVRYSQRYYDNEWEYRNVSIPREWVKEHSNIENMQILSEEAWRKFIAQSKGWEHFGYSRYTYIYIYIYIYLEENPLYYYSEGRLGQIQRQGYTTQD